MGGISLEETSFGHLLNALEAVKCMGYENQDARRIWCSDWTSADEDSQATAETKARTAKAVLCRMKSVAKTLAAISNSVAETIELVAQQSSCFVQSVGFSSLPDDVLARIFELCTSPDEHTWGSITNSVSMPFNLACVCRRFRRIALHVPCLWEDVCNMSEETWILKLKDRCQSPAVLVTFCLGMAMDEVDNFFRLLHPPNQWKALNIDCFEDDLHDVLEMVSTRSGGNFSSMESLVISPQLDTEEEGAQDEPPTTNLSDSDAALISDWRLPSLKQLTIKNFIPSAINCPNLKSCDIELSRNLQPRDWDLEALKRFFHSVHLIESLSLTFTNADYSLTHNNGADSRPITFPRLTSLDMSVGRQTEPKVLTYVMDAIETKNLSTLKISLDNGDVEGRYDFREWLYAIFTTSTENPRTLSSVKSLDLHMSPDDIVIWPDNQVLLALAVPNVQDLYLDLPTCFRTNLWDIARSFEDLRTLRLENCPSYGEVGSLEKAIDNLTEQGELDNITDIELKGYGPLSSHTERIRKRLGDKFIQGGLNFEPSS